MAERDILEQMGAKVSKRRVLLFIIGTRMKDHESGRSVPMLGDAPPFCTWCVDAGFAAPTDAQKKKCLDYWIKEPRSPSSFEWVEGGEPTLKPEPKPKKSTPNKEND